MKITPYTTLKITREEARYIHYTNAIPTYLHAQIHLNLTTTAGLVMHACAPYHEHESHSSSKGDLAEEAPFHSMNNPWRN